MYRRVRSVETCHIGWPQDVSTYSGWPQELRKGVGHTVGAEAGDVPQEEVGNFAVEA